MGGVLSLRAKEWQTLQFAPLWVWDAVARADGRVDARENEVFREEVDRVMRNAVSAWRKLPSVTPNDLVDLQSVKRALHRALDGRRAISRLWAQGDLSLYEAVVASVAFFHGGKTEEAFEELGRRWLRDRRDAAQWLSEVADLLDDKAPPEQAQDFKTRLLELGRKVAGASGGGLLGLFSGARKKKDGALEQIANALRA